MRSPGPAPASCRWRRRSRSRGRWSRRSDTPSRSSDSSRPLERQRQMMPAAGKIDELEIDGLRVAFLRQPLKPLERALSCGEIRRILHEALPSTLRACRAPDPDGPFTRSSRDFTPFPPSNQSAPARVARPVHPSSLAGAAAPVAISAPSIGGTAPPRRPPCPTRS